MASIRQLPSGNFQAAVLMPGGKRSTKTFEDEYDATEWAAKLETERNRLRAEAEARSDSEYVTLLLDELERFVEENRLSPEQRQHLQVLADTENIRINPIGER